jgi:putative DNA primase/helicase
MPKEKDRSCSLLPMPNAGKDKFDELKYAQAFMRKAPPILTRADDWFAFDGKCWRPRSKDTFQRLSMDVIPPQHRLARHSKAVMDHVERTRQCTEDMEFGSAVKWKDDHSGVIVNVHNGVLHVTAEKIELLPHDKELMFTGCLGASWLPNSSEMPLFNKVLHETLHDISDVALFQWFSGYCLYPDCKQHEVFLICYGPGGTGKSTLADAIVNAFSDDVLVTRLSLAQICNSGPGSYSLPSLQTALVNLGTELDTVEMDESANFKQIVSGEPIVARSIYGKPFKMQTNCKLWFLSNGLPRFKSGTDAEYRRARFLSFSKKPPEKDPTLKDRLREERDGILTWLVDGLQAILQGFAAPMGGSHSAAVLKRFELSNDPVGCFVRENCTLSADLKTPKDHVINAFSEFLDAHQFPHRTREYFFRALYERNPNIVVQRDRTGGETKHVLLGIGLK